MNNAEIIEREISELEQQPINYGNAEKLAYLYIVRDHLHRDIPDISDSEFMAAIQGKDISFIFGLIDELMTVLQAVNPRLYNGVMSKL